MAYSIDVDRAAQAAIDALPPHALHALAEVFTLLEIAPRSGRPVNPEVTPEGPVRTLPFADSGLVTYLVLDDVERVDVLVVMWAR